MHSQEDAHVKECYIFSWHIYDINCFSHHQDPNSTMPLILPCPPIYSIPHSILSPIPPCLLFFPILILQLILLTCLLRPKGGSWQVTWHLLIGNRWWGNKIFIRGFSRVQKNWRCSQLKLGVDWKAFKVSVRAFGLFPQICYEYSNLIAPTYFGVDMIEASKICQPNHHQRL